MTTSYVYIIYSDRIDKFYIGYTKNLEQRILTHQVDEGKWTAGKGPWRLVYFEEFKDDTTARKRELALKNAKNRRYLNWVICNGPGSSVG